LTAAFAKRESEIFLLAGPDTNLRQEPVGKISRPFSPSPLVAEGGSNERSKFETGEGSVSTDRDPSSAFASRRHLLPQGEKEEGAPPHYR
jgi:hypothetical protein